jgi:hypothetical protein
LVLLELAEHLEGTAELRPEELRGDNARHASGCHAGIIALEQLRGNTDKVVFLLDDYIPSVKGGGDPY